MREFFMNLNGKLEYAGSDPALQVEALVGGSLCGVHEFSLGTDAGAILNPGTSQAKYPYRVSVQCGFAPRS
ncbi:MAG: hypothetical protein WBO08_16030 [Mycobacterium sp.]